MLRRLECASEREGKPCCCQNKAEELISSDRHHAWPVASSDLVSHAGQASSTLLVSDGSWPSCLLIPRSVVYTFRLASRLWRRVVECCCTFSKGSSRQGSVLTGPGGSTEAPRYVAFFHGIRVNFWILGGRKAERPSKTPSHSIPPFVCPSPSFPFPL